MGSEDAPARGSLLIGQTIAGKYVLEERIGSGGMGILYRARQTDPPRLVAVKVLHPELTDDPEVKGRFDREMRATDRIEHPNSIDVYDCGEHEGRLFMVMELLDGRPLEEVIQKDAPFPAARTAHIGMQIAQALAAAHAARIIHRDLKPENIMIVTKGGDTDVVKVLDFGLSRLGEDDDKGGASLTQVGVRVGTPTYMSPEYVSTYAADHRSDLYALGVLLFEMATGQPPFTGRPFDILEKVVTEKPQPPSKLVPTTPTWLDKITLALLAKKPDDRPQSAMEVYHTLDRGRAESVTAPAAAPPPPPPEPTRQRAYTPLSMAAFPTDLLVKAKRKKKPKGDKPGAGDLPDDPTTEEVPAAPVRAAPPVDPPELAVEALEPFEVPAIAPLPPSRMPYVLAGCVVLWLLSAVASGTLLLIGVVMLALFG